MKSTVALTALRYHAAMIRKLAARLLNGCLRSLPQDLRAKLFTSLLGGVPESLKFRCDLPTVSGLLDNIKANGFAPRTIVDIGANVGNWSREVSATFPSARFIMLDANVENDAALRKTATEVGDGAESHIVLLGPEPRDSVPFYSVGTGSSVLPELTNFARTTSTLPMARLDDVIGRRPSVATPILMKLDVQGFELEVLKGGRNTLSRSEVVILETALLDYNAGAPHFSDVVRFMDDAGFNVFDFCGQIRRETDHTLFQMDVMFVKHDSVLRAAKKFFLAEP